MKAQILLDLLWRYTCGEWYRWQDLIPVITGTSLKYKDNIHLLTDEEKAVINNCDELLNNLVRFGAVERRYSSDHIDSYRPLRTIY